MTFTASTLRLVWISLCASTCLLASCGGVRLATLDETLEGLKESGKLESERRCDQHPPASMDHYNCRQQTRAVYEELNRQHKADANAKPDKTSP